MKRILGLIMVVAVLLLVLNVAGCVPPVVSQEEYNKAVAEREEAKAKVASLENELDKVKGEYEALKDNAAKAAAYVKFLGWHLAAAKRPPEEKGAEYWQEFYAKVGALKDSKLSEMFAEMGKLSQEMKAKKLTPEEMKEAPEMKKIQEIHKESCKYMLGKILELLELK